MVSTPNLYAKRPYKRIPFMIRIHGSITSTIARMNSGDAHQRKGIDPS